MGQCCSDKVSNSDAKANGKTGGGALDAVSSKTNKQSKNQPGGKMQPKLQLKAKMNLPPQERRSQLKMERGVFKMKIDMNQIAQTIHEKMSLRCEIAKIGTGGSKPVSGKDSSSRIKSSLTSRVSSKSSTKALKTAKSSKAVKMIESKSDHLKSKIGSTGRTPAAPAAKADSKSTRNWAKGPNPPEGDALTSSTSAVSHSSPNDSMSFIEDEAADPEQ